MIQQNIEAIYGLSPLQQGLLFHTLYAPESAEYFEQLSFPIVGRLDLETFEAVWQRVVARHSVLRTAFVWEGLDQPRQVVHKQVELPFERLDWRDRSEAAQQQGLAELLESDRRQGFQLTQAPLMRLILVRLAEDRHQLIWSHHHLLLDGWSVSLVIGEVLTLYRDAASRLSTSRPFRDYVRWLESQDHAAAETFWRRMFDGYQPAAGLNGKGDHSAVSDDYDRQTVALNAAASTALRKLATAHDLTLNTLVQGAWALLLGRYQGRMDVVFGVTSAGRPADLNGVETMVGLFVNTLPLRARGGWRDRLLPWLAELQSMGSQVRDYEYNSLVDVQQWSGATGRELFESILAFENYPIGDGQEATGNEAPGSGLQIPELTSIWERTNYPLTVQVLPGEQLTLTLLLDPRHFDTLEGTRIAHHFRRLLEGIPGRVDAGLSDLAMLSPAERHQLQVEWPGGLPVEEGGVGVMHQLFLARAEAVPESQAVTFEGDSLTYHQLAERAHRLAHHLRDAAGVGPEMPVAICLERSLDLVVAILGVLEAGGAYVPLDPSYPEERLRFLMDDARAPVAVTVSEHADRLGGSGAQVVCLDRDRKAIAARPAEPPQVKSHPEHLAYVIYTSGSTGRPKGVRVTHRHVARLMRATEPWFEFNEDDVWTLFHSYAFDFSVWELWGALAYGGRLVVVPYWISRSPDAFLKLLAEEGVTVLNQTPSAFRQLQTAVADAGEIGEEAPWSLRFVIFGGEALDVATLAPWFERCGDRRPQLVNMYGITETTVHVTYQPLSRADLDRGQRGSVGRPIPDLSVRLEGVGAEPMPIGRPGEMMVGGAGVAEGYLGRPGLAAQRFVVDPWAGVPGARRYRTGDLARIAHDGSLEYLGRTDHQLKIRGFRIEPGEIQAVLDEHPVIGESLVLATGDGPDGATLTAYLVVRSEAAATAAGDAAAAQVARWREVFEETYGGADASTDPTFNIEGWNRSADGAPLPADEMREWVDATVARVLNLGPQRVLEVGCGTGLLLYRIVPTCERYVGIDVSATALDGIAGQLAARGWSQVRLERLSADALDELAESDFDTVVINSVAQYFPSLAYLEGVLESAVGRVVDGGSIFVGDLRGFDRLRLFHAAVEADRAKDALDLQQLRHRVAMGCAQEEELAIDPAWFYALAAKHSRICGVEVQLRRGQAKNELIRYRYDVVLRIGTEEATTEPTEWHWRQEGFEMATLEQRLQSQAPDLVVVREINNRRLAEDLRRLELLEGGDLKTLGELRTVLAEESFAAAVDPEELWQLAERLSYEVEVGWGAEPGDLTATFRRPDAGRLPLPTPPAEGTTLATRPQVGAYLRALPADLRRFASDRLPAHMVPSAFVLLTAMPLTAHGKTDRARLPRPDDTARAQSSGSDRPFTATEERLAKIWGEVLGITRVGVDDSFFDLGGHSLLATRLISRVRKSFQVDVSLRALFTALTLSGLAAAIDLGRAKQAETGRFDLPELVVDVEGRHLPFPLTEVQEAYWVGRRSDLELGSVSAHIYMELESVGFDLDRLQTIWRRLIERHDMLRAVMLDDGRQQILESVPDYEIELLDLEAMTPEEAEQRLIEVRDRMSHQVLPVDRWPLFEIQAARWGGGRLRLFISLDVLLFDGWSLNLLSAELAYLYRDPEAALPPLEISFRDYVLAEQALHDSELYARSLDYWRGRLAELPPAPQLPLAVDPASLEATRFERLTADLDRESWDRLKERAREAGLTPSAVLLTAFSEVLARWSREPRFTVNLTLFNRLPLHPQVDRLLGDFTSLTLLAVDHSEPAPFSWRARQLQEQLWTDLDHRIVGGVRVMRELARQSGGQGGRMPVVFTSTLNLDPDAGNDDSDEAMREAPELELVHSLSQTPQVWLDHAVNEHPGGMVYTWDVVADLFPEGLVADMFDTYRQRLASLANGEAAWRNGEGLPLPAEQRQILTESNATEAPREDVLLQALFDRRVADRRDQPAVVAAGRSLTYGQLDRCADDLARRLREHGARPNTLVAVAAAKGWEQVAAVLGVLRSGAAYLPVDPGLPAERFGHLLARGEVRLAVCREEEASELSWPAEVEVVTVDEASLDRPGAAPLPPVQGTDDLAYVIFTSGSTGNPKGVMIDHRGAVNTVLDVNRRFEVGPEDRVLALSALGFDLSVYDIFGVLAAGGTVVMPEPWANRDPSHWLELMIREDVTLWNTVPALMQMLVEYVAGRDVRLPEALRLVLLSGDWIPLELPDRLRALASSAEVVSLGGATEASIWSILYPIGEVDPDWPSIPYGRPMDNQNFHVLGPDLEPRPAWTPGELYIGGIGVALGYWRDEEITAAAFVRHPRTGERLYRTGDFGRRFADGTIEFLGRQDNQVKIRGHRIELGEIEATLAREPTVAQAVVAAVGDDRHDRRLVAYVVREESDASESESVPSQMADRPVVGQQPSETSSLDPLAQLEFKISQHGLRGDAGDHSTVTLPGAQWPADVRPGGRLERRSRRQFAASTVPLEAMGELLGSLTQVTTPGDPLPRYRYGSAGSLYPVQVYLWVKPGRVMGLEGGLYYHDPMTHRLVLLTPAAKHPDLQPEDPTDFTGVAFSVYLVGKMEAIRPIYGDRSNHYAVLEAGLITQLLESTAPGCGLGLCQIGDLDFDRIRPLFHLGEHDEWLHSLVGGVPLEEAAEGSAAPPSAEDSDPSAVLERLLESQLPAYMVPRSWVFLDSLPLTANGKVDRGALARRAVLPVAPTIGAARPRSQLEEQIADILQQLIGVERVGVEDNFFEIGGTSVHLVQAHAKLWQLMGFEVPLIEMFNHPTVRDLANYLNRQGQIVAEAKTETSAPSRATSGTRDGGSTSSRGRRGRGRRRRAQLSKLRDEES